MHNFLYLLASSVFSKQALKSLGKLRFTEFHEIAKILSDSSSQALSADDGHTARHSILFHRFHLFQVVILLLRFSRFPTATSHSPRPTRYSFSHNPRHSFKTLQLAKSKAARGFRNTSKQALPLLLLACSTRAIPAYCDTALRRPPRTTRNRINQKGRSSKRVLPCLSV